jgi:superoxide dismutase, Cu-Zn family
MRRLVAFAAVVACAVGLVAQPASASPPPLPLPVVALVSYQPADSADSGAEALTYDPDLVPVGARATIVSVPTKGGTTTAIMVRGLEPNRTYGAHVHVRPCGPDPLASGPHFQNVQDPVRPSTDPAYANPSNEVWLDFTTNALGIGRAVSHVGWRFDGRPAASFVIHEHHTHTGPGEAGTAGSRLACADVPFGDLP